MVKASCRTGFSRKGRAELTLTNNAIALQLKRIREFMLIPAQLLGTIHRRIGFLN
jgi:hypothetical protein